MLTTAERDAILDTYEAGGSNKVAANHFAGLIKSVTNWRSGTVVEADYTGYGTRPSIGLGAPADTSPAGGRQRANDTVVTFPQNTGADNFAIGWGLYGAATGGTPKAIAFLDADPPVLGLVDDLTNDDVLAAAHGLSADQRVMVLATVGAVLPAGLSENTAYYVIATGLTTDKFRLSTTQGGAAVNITGKGAALFIPYTQQTIAANATPSFGVGTLVMQF